MDFFSIEPSENFMVSKVGANRTIGIWGNLTKNPRYKSIDITDSNISMTIPKALSLANVGVRIYLDNSESSSIDYVFHGEGDQMSVVGGVLHLHLLDLPEIGKTVEKWTIRPSNSSLQLII